MTGARAVTDSLSGIIQTEEEDFSVLVQQAWVEEAVV